MLKKLINMLPMKLRIKATLLKMRAEGFVGRGLMAVAGVIGMGAMVLGEVAQTVVRAFT